MGNTSPYRVLRAALNGRSRSKKTKRIKNGEFKFFNQLPAVLKDAISAPLSTKDAAHLSCSSKEMNELLKPHAEPMRLRKFLCHVVGGEHEAMQTMLQGNIDLLWRRGVVTDCSGREFGSISGFEYALWALDKFQWEDMLSCLPRDNTGHLTEEGQKIVTQLQQQYVHVKTNGVIYRLNEETKTESHYDFSIINALKVNVAIQNAPGGNNWDDISQHWRERVGGAQRLCPMHVVDEYCSDTPFYPLPQFNSRPKTLRDLHQFYNWMSSSWESWFAAESKLGIDLGIFKGPSQGGEAFGGGLLFDSGRPDLDAMVALCKTRTLDFSALKAQLESMMDIEERPRPVF